ncbi:KH domain-containing, RNA-binding, signal transduction-associated protein 2 [Chamberlinius hualienensis]
MFVDNSMECDKHDVYDLDASSSSRHSEQENNRSPVNSHSIRAAELKMAIENLKDELEQELERLQNGGVNNSNNTTPLTVTDSRYLEVTQDKAIKLQVKIAVPVKEHPKFNFVGKLLGPKGNSLKRLQEETLTKMAILGRGSMRDKAKEEELRALSDTKFAHLNEDLHVEVSTFAPPAEAYARISHALSEIKRFLVPDYNDDIRQDQLREWAYINGAPTTTKSGPGGRRPPGAPPLPPPPPPPPPPSSIVAAVAAARGSRVGLLATPPARLVGARGGPTRAIVRMPRGVPTSFRSPTESRIRTEDGFVSGKVFDEDYSYGDTYDDSEVYYEFSSGAPGTIETFSEEYNLDLSGGEEWRLGSDSSRLKAPPSSRSSTRGNFRDRPYNPPKTSSTVGNRF